MNTFKKDFPIRENIMFPVQYDGNQKVVRDRSGKLICDLKSWCNIELLNKSREPLEAIGEKIVKLLNESEVNKIDYNDTELAGSQEETMEFEWD